MSAARWQLEEQKARLADAAIEASIDLAHPERGLLLGVPDKPNAKARFCVLGFALGNSSELAGTEIDAYIRQNDLIAIFERTQPEPMRAQIYWRFLEPTEFAAEYASHVHVAFDLIASVNTSLLDSDPASTVRSSIDPVIALLNLAQTEPGHFQAKQLGSALARGVPAAEAISPLDSQAGCFIARFASNPLSWLEMVHPADFHGSRASLGDSSSIPGHHSLGLVHDLFAQRLEKGVILRARVRGALVGRENDAACATAAFRKFSASEPALTV